MQYIKSLKSITESDFGLVGNRAATIAKLANNFGSLYGFVITENALKKFIEENRLLNQGYSKEKISELIKSLPLSKFLFEEILESYHSLHIIGTKASELLTQKMPAVIVRASPLRENVSRAIDLKDDVLNIKSEEKLISAVKDIWSMYWEGGVAVIIQQMPDPIVSGEIYTTNKDNESEILIRASFGMSSALIPEKVASDEYRVDKKRIQIIDTLVRKQDYQIILDPETEKLERENMLEGKAMRQKLSNDQILDVAKFGKRIEILFSMPLLVYFIYEKNRLVFIEAKEIEKDIDMTSEISAQKVSFIAEDFHDTDKYESESDEKDITNFTGEADNASKEKTIGLYEVKEDERDVNWDNKNKSIEIVDYKEITDGNTSKKDYIDIPQESYENKVIEQATFLDIEAAKLAVLCESELRKIINTLDRNKDKEKIENLKNILNEVASIRNAFLFADCPRFKDVIEVLKKLDDCLMK
ncbi:MAG: PEP/pyruvate-binding domain-containing protein [Candidatus Woesearchaeota archaeon]